jgi:hypothetical protein
MQKWYAFSDPTMEDALDEIESMRRFAGLELGEEEMLDETTILRFRHWFRSVWFECFESWYVQYPELFVSKVYNQTERNTPSYLTQA